VVIELIGGLLSGSLALLADTLHNFSDSSSILISYFAYKLGLRPKNKRFTFGYKRVEIFAALINGTVLLTMYIFLLRESVIRLLHPESLKSGIVIWVASAGLILNVLSTLLLKKDAENNINIRSAYVHLLSDSISSVAVILAAIIIHFTNAYFIDPLLTILIGLYVMKMAYGIIANSVNILMNTAPAGIDINDIKKEIEALEGVINVHHVHLWQPSEHDIHFEAHIEIPDMNICATEPLLKKINDTLKTKFNIGHTTIQFENNICDDKSILKNTH